MFVYGIRGGAFPVRQHVEASRAIARLHGLDPERTLFVAQSEEAIAAGAFHNDVVAVANENVLFAHEQAFEDRPSFYAELKRLLPEVEIVEVPASAVSLEDAIRSYLFNAQLVTLPAGGMALILPEEARETPSVWTWLQAMVAGNGPIRELFVVDVRQSMANGGGPACLRLRVVAEPEAVDPRFMVDEAKLDRLAGGGRRRMAGADRAGGSARPAAVDADGGGEGGAARRARAGGADLDPSPASAGRGARREAVESMSLCAAELAALTSSFRLGPLLSHLRWGSIPSLPRSRRCRSATRSRRAAGRSAAEDSGPSLIACSSTRALLGAGDDDHDRPRRGQGPARSG